MLLALKPLEKNREKQQWHMRFGRWDIIEGCLLFWDFTEFLSLFAVSQSSASVGETVAYSILFKNATDVSKEINTSLCRFFSGSAFASILCLVLKELVTPRLSLTYGHVSQAIRIFYFWERFFFKYVLSSFLIRIFRSLLFILSLKGIIWHKCCFPYPQMYHSHWIMFLHYFL